MAKPKKNRVNEEIRLPRVRLIGEDDTQFGVVSIDKALTEARAANLDLVEVSPNADPPVCRIMDYGKHLYKEKKKKQKQKATQVKEIKLRPGTEEGDYQVKLRKVVDFLEEGNKVKITLRFRGRELLHREVGMAMLGKFRQDLAAYGQVEQEPKLEGRQLVMVIAPAKAAAK